MFGNIFKKKNKSSKSSNPSNVILSNAENTKELEKKDSKFLKSFTSMKKDLLTKDTLTREEIYKEIEKQLKTKTQNDSNPFKTREDVYYLFYDSNMKLNRAPVPFEEIRIGGKPFFIHKKFENGRIDIEYIFAAPDVEIDLKGEYAKKETTKKQLEKINKELLHIKNEIANGNEKYKLLDIGDLEEEKFRLERILESIKYGKSAIFVFQDPITQKKAYMLKYRNGEYKYLKITENNYITEENNIRFLKGYQTKNKLEEVVNFRITQNFKEIFMAFAGIIIAALLIFSFFKLTTFEEVLFDKRVKDYCGSIHEDYQDEIKFYKNLARKENQNDANSPSYKQQI